MNGSMLALDIMSNTKVNAMNEMKINSEIKIDSSEPQSVTGEPAKELETKIPKKNSFEEVLKKISELRKGKNFATDLNYEKNHSLSSDGEELTLIEKTSKTHISEINRLDIEEKEIENGADTNINTDTDNVAAILEIENAINPELQSILLGPNTQIITSKEIESDSEQLIAYARNAGLNENAISILLNGTIRKKSALEQPNSFEEKTLKEATDVPPNLPVKKSDELSLNLIQHNFQKRFPSEVSINSYDFKFKTTSEKINKVIQPKKTRTVSEETVDVENSKNFKMLMKVKDENFLDKLLVKKIEEEKNPGSSRIERLQSIELGARASQFINTLLVLRNSEISQSSKHSEIDPSLFSNSSSNIVGKLDSSASSGNQHGSGREQQTDQIQLKRQEQFQQMAQRLGETLAKRIIEQISKGAWRVQIALKPASLGNIEISLNLRGKEIEASFHANQALTRELLAESLPRLKDSLEKAGMNVAQMHVTGQNESKSGNNSTNEEDKDKDKEIKIDKIKTDNEEDGKTKESISYTDQSGGLNILV